NPSGKYGGDAATRKALAHSLGLAEDAVGMPNSYRPRRAYDQEMPPRGGSNYPAPSDPNGGETIDAEEAEARLQAIFDALDPAERPAMLMALGQFLEEHQGEPAA